jgi:hypothetical protein
VSIDPAPARRYFLGQTRDEEASELEQAYFAREEDAEQLAEIEHGLIEEYLDGQLEARDRAAFEQHYLASSAHRTRVALIRQLRERAMGERSVTDTTPGRSRRLPYVALAAAAGLLMAMALGWFALTRAPQPAQRDLPEVATRETAPAPQAPAPPAPPVPRVLALTLGGAGTRSGGDAPTLRIPPEIDVVHLRLEGEAPRPAGGFTRVVVREVGGAVVWEGAARRGADLPAGILAHVEVPADRLAPNDYIVVLFEGVGPDAREWSRYFLRVLNASRPGG